MQLLSIRDILAGIKKSGLRLRFVLKCEQNLSEGPNLDQMEQPAWWPPDLPFSESILSQRQHRGVGSEYYRKSGRIPTLCC